MADQPFTPHADSIQTAWVLMCQQSRISTQPPVEELEAEFDRFIVKVKRDAAREALDGLIEAWLGKYGTPETQDAGIAVRDYREMNYRLPEDVAP